MWQAVVLCLAGKDEVIMNYDRIVARLRRDSRIFTAPNDHKIHRILLHAKRRKVEQYPPSRVGPYSGLTAAELRMSGTCETDWA